jgi:hypothetical protein
MPAMVRLTGEEAIRRLDSWWRTVRRSHFPRQHVIHILKPFTPDEFEESPAYKIWRAGGPDALRRCLELLDRTSAMFPYLHDALVINYRGVANTRIFLVRREDFQNSGNVQRYAAEVLHPFFANTGETILMLFQDDYDRAGFPPRTIDVNLWGVAGIMRTGYAGGDVAWREFLSWWRNPFQSLSELRFVLRVERFARQHGIRIEPADW